MSKSHIGNKTGFQKGYIPWNKGKKGVREYPKGKNHSMYGVHRYGEEAPNWKGGKKKNNRGYVFIFLPKHSNSNNKGYIFEHRLIMEKKLGRFLKSIEVVHHINNDKSDNRIENLILFSNDIEHRAYHKRQRELLRI